MRYKKGDRVVVKTWEEMAKKFGSGGSGSGVYIDTKGYAFIYSMKENCGKTFTITGVFHDCYKLEGDTSGCSYTDDMLDDPKPVARANGTKVRIRSWESMEKEFGLASGSINVPCSFGPTMKHLCGQTFTIESSKLRSCGKEYTYHVVENSYYYSEGMFEKGEETVLSSGRSTISIDQIKAGMKVRVKSLDALVAEYGVDAGGNIAKCPGFFNRDMKQYCGRVFTVKSVFSGSFSLTEPGASSWSWSAAMISEIVEDARPAVGPYGSSVTLVYDHVMINSWSQTHAGSSDLAFRLGATKWESGARIDNQTKVAIVNQDGRYLLVTDGKREVVVSPGAIKKIEEAPTVPLIFDHTVVASGQTYENYEEMATKLGATKWRRWHTFKEGTKIAVIRKNPSGDHYLVTDGVDEIIMSIRGFKKIEEPTTEYKAESKPVAVASLEKNKLMGNVFASMTPTSFDSMMDELLEGIDD